MLPTAYATETLFCLVSVILSLLTGGILLLYSARKANVFLGLSYLAFGAAFTVVALTSSRMILYVPHVYRTANIFFLLYMPLSYLYVRSSINHKPLTAWQFLHFLPVLVYIVDFFPFFLLSGAQKAVIIREEIRDAHILLRYGRGWLLPANFHFQFRLLQMTVYWILQVKLLASPAAARMRKDRFWVHWQYIYLGLQLPIFLAPLIFVISSKQSFYPLTIFPPAAAILLSAITLLLYPRILYNVGPHSGLRPGGRLRYDPDKDSTAQLRLQMERHMEEKTPFLDPDYTIGELADAMGVPLHKLSAYINQATGKHFSDYINEWRIGYCVKLIREKKIVNLNLNGIANKCGFNNRNTFSTAFKKYTGTTPSTYLHTNV
jgi:AraC-like DNA-binding protein